MPADAPLEISSERHGAWLLIHVAGELDLATAPRLAAACAQASGQPVAISLSGVGFIDSSGLDALIELSRCSQRLVLVEPSGVVRRLLGLTDTTDAFDIVDSVDSLARRDIAS